MTSYTTYYFNVNSFRLDRVSSKDGVIEGIRIPAGTICEIPVMALHRDPELWEDPDEFRPERFQYFP